jgi:hypothetical protein
VALGVNAILAVADLQVLFEVPVTVPAANKCITVL